MTIVVTNSAEFANALATAPDGETIELAAGIYAGNFTITGQHTIVGQGDGDDVVIQGTFKTDNGIAGTVADHLKTALSYSGSAGIGITIAADNVTIQNLKIESFNTGIELGNGIENVTVQDVIIESTVNGIRKGSGAEVTNFDLIGGEIVDGVHGIYFAKETASGLDISDVTIDGTAFTNLISKGIYAESLNDALITDITMTTVGEFGRGPAFNPGVPANWGGFGNGIDINLKWDFGEDATDTDEDDAPYSNITIQNFTFTDVGSSNKDGAAAPHGFGGAFAIKARDDAPGYHAPEAASFSGSVIIQNGTINGTSVGILAGEPGKNVTGPAVTITNVSIEGELVADVNNVSQSTMTVNMQDGGDVTHIASTTTGDIVVNGGTGVDEVQTTQSFTLGTGVENLTLLDLATNVEDFEDFDLGPVANGENGWSYAGTSDQEVVADGGDQAFRMSSDPSTGAFGGPYAPILGVTAGESTTTAGADSMRMTFTLKAVQPGDNSRLELDFGNQSRTDRINFMAIENTAAGLRIATAEPRTDGNWETGAVDNTFTAFTGNRTIVEGLDNTVEHEVTLVLNFVDGSNNDVISIYVDGEKVGETTTFENYREFHLGQDHATAQQNNQGATVFFRNNAAGAPQDGASGQNQGFLIDDISYSSFDAAGPSGTGNELANLITGNSGDNALSGLGEDDTLNGGLGDDSLTGGAGNDDLSGAEGTDTAVYGGALDASDFSYNEGTNTWTVDATGISEGTDALTGMEAVETTSGRFLLVDENGSYTTIQAAIDAANPGDTILVAAGNYNENIVIDKSLTLLSLEGRDATTITGVGAGGELGAITILPGVNNVRIGDAGMGFTVVGINGNGAIEKAAIYLQGNHDEIDIEGNRVTANGDAGLSTEFAAAVTDLRIDGNIFDGQTFEGSEPGGTGFSTQFDPGNNVPRQLVVIGNGGGGAGPANYPTKNVFFTNNEVVGTAGGVNGGGEQGNTLVTIDADTSVISGNSFTGFTNYTGVALRARGPNTSIENNTIDHDVNGSESNGFFVNNKGFPATYAGNVIDGGAANETLGGTPGDDLISGDAGTDGLAGGLGTDTAQYAQAITTSMLAESGGNWTVTTGGAEGTDTLNDMEIVDGAEAGKILLVGSGGFATIQEAVDAADAGDTIMVGAGTFAGATITKELTIVGSGIGNTIITSGPGSAGFDLSGDIDATSAGSATVTISGFTFTGNSVGVRGASNIELDHLVVQNSHFEQNKIHGIGTGSGAFGLGDVQILDSSFVRNGDGSSNGDGDIVLFGFTGDALIQNVTVEGGANAIPTNANADSAIQINGRNPSTYDVVDPIGNVVFDNVEVTGSYAKVIVYIQGYTNLDGLLFDAGGTTIDGHAGWGYGLYIDTTGGVSTSALPPGVVDGVQGFFDETAAGALAPNNVDLTNVTLGNDIAINVGPSHPFYAVNGQAFDSVLVGTPVADDFIGSAGEDLLIGGAGNDTLAGAGGNDAYFIDGGETLVEGVAGGTDTVYSSVTHTLGANFENLTLLGTANINGTGNGDANVIIGNSGNNVLAGLAGADTLNGGDGTDTADYSASAASVSVSLASGVGIGGDADGDQLVDIENLIGSSSADNLVGDDEDNVFAGLAGADTISGGGGNDTVDYSASTNQITIDLSTLIGGFVRPTGGHAAGDRIVGIENVIGSSSTDQITGDANANKLTGGDGNDSLNGLGGDDTLDGGDGNDTFTVDSTNDVVTDSSGIDLVNSFATYTLAEGLEKLTLLSGADLDGTGNSGDNTIKGNSGANELFGLGGKDAITGGGGNDTIDGGEGNDNLNGNGGDDSILGGLGVDKLRGEDGEDTIAGGGDNDQLYGGDDSDQLDGDDGVDQLFGEDGNDVLNGGIGNDKLDGGAGADTMDGGEGNDTYTVDDVNDVVSETISGVSGGKDVVKSSAATFTLGANVETLTLTGSGNINGTGNDEDNTIS
ncbi:MAG: hypothetical protein HXY30_03260, partial [Pseudorhodoplanes sp.]|nr:hypothetical protein [Pseudorhodoplanes sp.]